MKLPHIRTVFFTDILSGISASVLTVATLCNLSNLLSLSTDAWIHRYAVIPHNNQMVMPYIKNYSLKVGCDD